MRLSRTCAYGPGPRPVPWSSTGSPRTDVERRWASTMLQNLTSSGIWVVIAPVLVVLMLILAPSPARQAVRFTEALRRIFFGAATTIFAGIRRQWSLYGERERQEKRNLRKFRQEVNRRIAERLRRKLPISVEDEARIRQEVEQEIGEAWDPTIGIIVSAWTRRFAYLLLVLVCVSFDFILVSSRLGPLLFAGEAPSFLISLFQYLQIIVGIFFVSIAALSGMLIAEYSNDLPDAVKIEPDLSETQKRARLTIAISMIVINVAVVVSLAVLGVDLQFTGTVVLNYLLIVTVGSTVLVVIGVFLAFEAVTQAAGALALLSVGSATGSMCVFLGLVATAANALLRGICSLGAYLRRVTTKRG